MSRDKRRKTAAQVLRSLHLPVENDPGVEVPFIPPKNWRPHQALDKGGQHGYLDRWGREWTKGPTRTEGQHFEWDVQLPDGGHLNIDWGGRITHPRPDRAKKRED